jgi:hypothetical protein
MEVRERCHQNPRDIDDTCLLPADARAAFWPVLDPAATTVRLDHAFADRQPQPRAVAISGALSGHLLVVVDPLGHALLVPVRRENVALADIVAPPASHVAPSLQLPDCGGQQDHYLAVEGWGDIVHGGAHHSLRSISFSPSQLSTRCSSQSHW